MKQLLHVLRKDVRHFSPEILLNLALFAAFAAVVPKLWLPASVPTIDHILEMFLRVLLPLGWLVMIARVLHDEPLVGDRQFWLTRPYSRSTLLTEKLTFLVLFLHLPLFLTQSYLLYRAGLPVGAALGGLLHLQLGLFLIFVLPLVAVSAVTANFSQNLLWLLGAIVYLVLIAMLTAWTTRRQMTGPGVDWVLFVVFEAGLAAVVVWMYSRRSVLGARALLVGLPLLVVLAYLCAPTQWLIRRAYAASTAPKTLIFDNAKERVQTGSGKPLLQDGDVAVELPVRLQNVSENDESIAQGGRITLQAADGATWTSGYERASSWLRGTAPQPLHMTIPLAVYQRMQGESVTVSMQAEMTRYEFGPAQHVTVPATGSFDVPSRGKCTVDPVEGFLRCRYALYNTPALLLRFEAQVDPCEVSGQSLTVQRRTDGSTPGSLNWDVNPVFTRDIPLSKALPSGNQEQSTEQQVNLCPGAHASFQEQTLVAREQFTVTTPPLQLNDYVPHEHSLSGVAR